MKIPAVGNLSFGKMSEQKMKFSKGRDVDVHNMFGDREDKPESCSLGERG